MFGWFDTIVEFLNGKTFVKLGYGLWNNLSDLAMSVLGQTPAELAGGSLWTISMDLMVLMKIIGASLFNVFFFVNFCQKSSNLRDNQTMESVILMFIKLILGNMILVNIDGIINGLSEVMQGLFSIVAPEGTVSVRLLPAAVDEWDNDSLLLGLAVSFLFLFVCIGGGLLLVLHVYGIFIKVFFYIVIGPLAISTVPGPDGAARSAESWFKTFLCALGEFAGAALVLRLCAAMVNANAFLIPLPDELAWVESAWNMVQSMLVILLAVGSVKMVDSMIRRACGF